MDTSQISDISQLDGTHNNISVDGPDNLDIDDDACLY